LFAEAGDGDSDFLKQGDGDAFGLVEEGEKKVLVGDFLLVELAGEV